MDPSADEQKTPFITPIPGRSWGFAYVKSRTEKKFRTKLSAMGISCYLPLLHKMRVHHREKILSEIPMFSGYVFLCPDPVVITEIRRQTEVVGLNVLEGTVETEFIRELNLVRKLELLASTRKVVINPGLYPGQTVRVTSGPFRDTEVIVLRRVNEIYMIVNLRLLGRSCECKIAANELKGTD